MTAAVLLEMFLPIGAIYVVAAGIHLHGAAPAQRRGAWWNFGFDCLVLTFCVVLLWRGVPDLAGQGVNPVFTGWDLAVPILGLIVTGIGSVSSLLRELRQVSARHIAPPH